MDVKKLSAVMIGACLLIWAQAALLGQTAEDIVKAKLFLSKTKILAGETLKLALKVKIQRQWHIHANKLSDEFLVPTSFTVEKQDGFETLEIVYPKPKMGKYEYSETALEVFDGEVLIGTLIQAAPGLAPGPYKLKVKFKFQTCDNRGCLPPKTYDLAADVTIVAAAAQTTEDNADIFKKIAFTKLK